MFELRKMWQIYTRLEHTQKAVGSKLFWEIGAPYFRKQEKCYKRYLRYSVLEKIKVSMQFCYVFVYVYVYVCVCVCVYACIYTHILVFIFKIQNHIIYHSGNRLAKAFTLKHIRVKSSDAVIYLKQNQNSKADSLLVILGQVFFFCFSTQETTFYGSIGITSLQSFWNCETAYFLQFNTTLAISL